MTETLTKEGTLAGAARMERPDLARLAVRGSDAKDLLHRITSNDLEALGPGEGCATLLLERTGRFVDRLLACDRGAEMLLIGSVGRGDAVRGFLEKFVIAEDVQIEDLAPSTRLVTVAGERAADVVAGLGADGAGLPRFHHRPLAGGGVVVRAEDVGGRAFHVLLPADAPLPDALAGVDEMDADTWRALRIRSGIPAFGEEYGDRTIALETRMVDAISFTKGCFVGQEVVARLHNHRRVKRALARLRIEGDAVPAEGAVLLDGDDEVGRIVSAVTADGQVVALAYVRAGSEKPGTSLALADGDGRRAVEVLPLTPAGDPE